MGTRTSAIAYTCNETMHQTVEKAQDALNTSKDKSELAPTDANQDNGSCSSCSSTSPKATAKFKWYDPSSWFFPGTNYCGATKSGPGQTTSRLDACCQMHDTCLKNAKGSWWIPSYKTLDCHDEFINCKNGDIDPYTGR